MQTVVLQMEVTDRAAYESLRRKYDYLTTALQPADILPSLFACGLISIVQMQEIELAIHERGPAQGYQTAIQSSCIYSTCVSLPVSQVESGGAFRGCSCCRKILTYWHNPNVEEL